jgi:predicted tellurium resistance membrane protein TerC
MQVLSYGLISAAVLRAIMILGGAALIENFEPVLLAFAGVLLFSSFKLLSADDEDEDEDLTDNFIVKLCRYGQHVLQNCIHSTDLYRGRSELADLGRALLCCDEQHMLWHSLAAICSM